MQSIKKIYADTESKYLLQQEWKLKLNSKDWKQDSITNYIYEPQQISE